MIRQIFWLFLDQYHTVVYNRITFEEVCTGANLYSMLKNFILNLKKLSDASVVSLTKKEYGSAVYFL